MKTINFKFKALCLFAAICLIILSGCSSPKGEDEEMGTVTIRVGSVTVQNRSTLGYPPDGYLGNASLSDLEYTVKLSNTEYTYSKTTDQSNTTDTLSLSVPIGTYNILVEAYEIVSGDFYAAGVLRGINVTTGSNGPFTVKMAEAGTVSIYWSAEYDYDSQPLIGAVLSINDGALQGGPFTYQWQKLNAFSTFDPIPGATSLTYTVQFADKSETIRVVATPSVGTPFYSDAGSHPPVIASHWIPINSEAELRKISATDPDYTLSESYLLMKNITLTSPWTPIGNFTNKFEGFLNGNFKTISGLSINNPGADYQGLVGYLDLPGQIQNIGIVDGNVIGQDYVGALVGYKAAGWVFNCYSTASVKGENAVGGLVGSNFGSVEDCYSTGSVTSENLGSNTGGIVGSNDGSVKNCYSTGVMLMIDGDYVGGIVGFNGSSGTIEKCVALNPTITLEGIGIGIGRVGYDSASGLQDNYARDDMTLMQGGSSYTPTPGPLSIDGEDVAATGPFGYNGNSFYSSMLGWDFYSTWQMGTNSLPALCGF